MGHSRRARFEIYEQNDLEIFIAASDAYYESEISARNVIYEAFWNLGRTRMRRAEVFGPSGIHRKAENDGSLRSWRPRASRPVNDGVPRLGLPRLEPPSIVNGTLNKRDDIDRGWFRGNSYSLEQPALLADGRSLPPKDGDVWRNDLFPL